MRILRRFLLAAALLQAGSLFAQAIVTVAGTGASGYNGDDPAQTATSARLFFPLGLALDAAGNLYIADSSNHRVRKVTPAGVITTFAGNGTPGLAAAQLAVPTALALDSAGNLYIADAFNHRIQKVEAATGTVSTVAGTGAQGSGDDGIAATASALRYPRGVAVDGAGNLYISDTENHRVRKVAPGGIITTVAGTNQAPGCSTTALNQPRGLAVSPNGDLYIADSANFRVMRLSGATLEAFAGPATGCTSGSTEGAAATARFGLVTSVSVTDAGDVLVADADNNRIRKVSGGTVSTVAGTTAGFSGDGGAAAAAQMTSPRGVVAVPGSGAFFLSDFGNHRVRKVALIAPAAPTLLSATPGNGQVTLDFGAGYDGGSPVTSFTATCTPGPFTQAGAASPLTVTGLANETQYTCSVTATNAIGTSAASATLTATPGIAPVITSGGPPGGTVGVAYAHTVTASGTPAPQFTIASGAFPAGLSIAASGAITGTPTEAGNFSVNVRASNGVPPASDQLLNIIIAKGTQAIAFDPLPDRALGAGPFTLTAVGGASGNPVVFTSTTPTICTTTGTNGVTLTLLAVGTCTVKADQAANANYDSAPTEQRSFAISIVPTTLSLSASAIDFGGQSMGTTSPARVITVTNTGPGPIVLSSLSSSDPQFGVTHDCSAVQVAATCTINVTFTPAPAGGPLNSTAPSAGTLTLATTATGSPHTVTLAGTGEKSLVTHYYHSILRRDPDAQGKDFWIAESTRVVGLGANVNEAWYAMATAFFSSPEYIAFNRAPDAFVTDLYATFFNRAPDSDGLAFWVGQLGAGMPREVLLVSFLFSSEFTSFSAGIFGNNPVRAELDAVMDFYRGLLSRLPDAQGFDFWVARFRAAQCAGGGAVAAEAEAISSLFATSGEYLARNRTDAQYVGDLYNAFLRRGGELSGVQFWIGQLTNHTLTREQVRQSFRASAEFGQRVTAILNAGCPP